MAKILQPPYTGEALAEELNHAASSGEVLLIKNGRNEFSPEEWTEFLGGQCGLTLDTRHYDATGSGITHSKWWEISYQPEKATVYAHSNTRHPLHNDNAWFSDPAEINFFIMEKQASAGGLQSIYPVPRLIEDLASDDPALLSDLESIEVVISKGQGDQRNRTTIIKNAPSPLIFWNFYRVDKTDPAIKRLCETFFAYLEKREQTSSVEFIKCDTGDCLCFHDQKVLHGRTSFSATKPFERVLLQSMWRLPSQ